jgi:hypothetical protein
MKKYIVCMIILCSVNFVSADEKCHLGKNDIGSLKSCNVDLRSSLRDYVMPKKNDNDQLTFCTFLGDLGKYFFYSNVGKLATTKVITNKYKCAKYGWEKHITKSIHFDKKSAGLIVGFSKDLPLKSIKRVDFGWTRESPREEAKMENGNIELDSPGLSFKTLSGNLLDVYEEKIKKFAKENKSLGPNFHKAKADTFRAQILFNKYWVGGRHEYAKFHKFTFVRSFHRFRKNQEEGVLLFFIFDFEGNLVKAMTPLGSNQTSVPFVPYYVFNLYGVKYYIFGSYTSPRLFGTTLIYHINGKGYHSEMGSFTY